VPQIADRLKAVRIRQGADGDVALDVVPQFRDAPLPVGKLRV
jgi:hypothetical protein